MMEMRPVRSSIQPARSLPRCLVRALILAIIGLLASDHVRLFAGLGLYVHVVLDVDGSVLADLEGVVPEAVRGRPARVLPVYVIDSSVARAQDFFLLRAPPHRATHVRAGVVHDVQLPRKLPYLGAFERLLFAPVFQKGGE